MSELFNICMCWGFFQRSGAFPLNIRLGALLFQNRRLLGWNKVIFSICRNEDRGQTAVRIAFEGICIERGCLGLTMEYDMMEHAQ